MTTPDLPPLPEPFVPLYGDERHKWADQMRAYAKDHAAAAVLAEREKSGAMQADAERFEFVQANSEWRREIGDCGEQPYAMFWLRLPYDADLSCKAMRVAAIDAARAAIRAEPNDDTDGPMDGSNPNPPECDPRC